MRILLLILIVVFSLSCENKKKSKTVHGFSKDKLNNIDSYAQSLIENNELPGVVVMVKKGDDLIYFKGFGYSDAEKEKKIDKKAIFRIASITKTITAFGILKLMEDGKINLDDEIGKYIPEFNDLNIYTGMDSITGSYITRPAINKITIRDLLKHRSGLGYGPYTSNASNTFYSKMYTQFFKDSLINLYTTKNVSLKNNIKNMAKIPLVNEPGTLFTYSWSYEVLGRLIEIVSQKSLNTFFNETFFVPLEMENTSFYVNKDKSKLLVPVLTNKNGYWTNYKSASYDINYPIKGAKTYFSGGAGLNGTILDYSNFLTMVVNKGRFKQKRILKKETVLLIQTIYKLNTIQGIAHVKDEMSHGIASGMTVRNKNDDSLKEIKILFWSGMFGCSYFINPKDKTILLVFKQVHDLKNIVDYDDVFQNIILDASIN